MDQAATPASPLIRAFERLKIRAERCRAYSRYNAFQNPTTDDIKNAEPEDIVLTEGELSTANDMLKAIVESYNVRFRTSIKYIDYYSYSRQILKDDSSEFWEHLGEISKIVSMWCNAAMLQIDGLSNANVDQVSLSYYGDIHIGDVFSNISNSTIVNRSRVESAFNALNEGGHEEAAKLILAIGEIVAASNDVAAAAVYTKMTDELLQKNPNQGVLKSCWNGLVAILPSVATLASAAMKVFGPSE